MLTLEIIKDRLKMMNIAAVAKEVGVHQNAIYRLMKEESNPSYDTVKKLSDFLEESK